MKQVNNDKLYMDIIAPILENKDFNKLKDIEHHGVTRFDHSMKVSYYSYKLSKVLKLDYTEVARAGLLHDFFLSSEDRSAKDRFISTFTHPKKAVNQTKKYFELSEKEENIIHSHMFPLYCSLPKYAESWVVSLVDKIVGSYEFGKKFGYKIGYIFNIYAIVFLNFIK